MIVLVRHAEAVDEGPEIPDAYRYLTRSGRAAARALAAELRAGGFVPDRVRTSPLVRAVQTAELIVAALGLELEIEIVATAQLAPGGAVDRVARTLLTDDGGVVLAVGHEPSISGLAGVLTSNPGFPAMRKAEACVIADGAMRGFLGSSRRGGGGS